MAERTNAEKLAAGRRKLKEFQQKFKEKSPVQNKKSREIVDKDEEHSTAPLAVYHHPPEKLIFDDSSCEKFISREDSHSPFESNTNKDTLINIDSKYDHSNGNQFQLQIDQKNDGNGGKIDAEGSIRPLYDSTSPEKSSTEALRQLSMQMDGLVADSLLLETEENDVMLNDNQRIGLNVELQNRNQELAGLLEEEKRRSDALQVQIKECKSRIFQLESEKESWISDNNLRIERETRPLREQLQLHVQTVGVLVGEKTELSAALSRSQVIARQRAELVEELQTKLRDSQVRHTELARELAAANEERGVLKEQLLKCDVDAGNFSAKLNQISLQLEEKNQEVSEARQKLSIRSSEVTSLQKELEEVKSKLSLACLRLYQLTGSNEGTEDATLEQIGKDEVAESFHQHRMRLERQNEDLKRAAREAIEEREEAGRRFQTYIHTLNGQMEVLARKVEGLTSENKTLMEREQSLVNHLSELEKQLQKNNNKSASKDEEDNVSAYRMSLEKKCTDLQDLFNQKNEEYELLQEKLKAYEIKLQETETELDVERQKRMEKEALEEDGSRLERERLLLAAMESDKVAASRAVDQNFKLKAEVGELQDAFVRLSNDKLYLTEKLNKEQHLSKDQAEKLSKLEEELNQLRMKQEMENNLDHIEQEDNENIKDLKKQLDAMQQERDMLGKKLSEKEGEECDSHIDSPPVESENLGLQGEDDESNEAAVLSNDHNLTESEAVKKLEERFRCTMDEVAALHEEKQRLEHLVLQLQGETETIGEYVALYQTQRGLLRQRAREKDEQLKKLSKDREELRCKLAKLEGLVVRLVKEEKKKDGESIENELVEKAQEAISEPIVQNEDFSSTNSMKGQTAGQIMALLNEIGSSSSLSEASIPSTFHPCPWCSGQLLTV